MDPSTYSYWTRLLVHRQANGTTKLKCVTETFRQRLGAITVLVSTNAFILMPVNQNSPAGNVVDNGYHTVSAVELQRKTISKNLVKSISQLHIMMTSYTVMNSHITNPFARKPVDSRHQGLKMWRFEDLFSVSRDNFRTNNRRIGDLRHLIIHITLHLLQESYD